MKLLVIDVNCKHGSTGRIAYDLYKKNIEAGGDSVLCYGRGPIVNELGIYRYAYKIETYLHVLSTRLFDNIGLGFNSYFSTERLINIIKKFNPDTIHLHDLHGYTVNIELLFKYLAGSNKKIIWTFHDCWAFTGHCAYFTYAKCNKWKIGCDKCPQKKEYPKSIFFDRSKKNYEIKKKLFTSIKKDNLKIITPSNWLKNLVKESFFKDYEVEVVYNTIDTNIFKLTKSNFREIYGLQNKIVILGVAAQWTKRKGLEDFIKLSKKLDDRFVIVLVGPDKKQIKDFKNNVITIDKTNNALDLVKIYSSADYFVNPSYEETFGLTMLEASKCGSQTICYDETACAEVSKLVLNNKNYIVPTGDVDAIAKIIMQDGGGIENNDNSSARFILINRTQNAKILAAIYIATDYFINTTYEENYPTVNLEAKACGCKIITYDTGGCRETLEK